MNDSPAVSVVLPVYNCQRYLPRAVESVLEQTFGDFELIAVNDGSKDSSLEILKKYAAKDDRVRVVSRPNTGIVGALNDGLAVARAPLIARMDGDDVSLPQRFEKQVAYLNQHPECALLGTQVLLVDGDDAPIHVKPETRFTHDEIDFAHLNLGWPVVHPTVMIRRQFIDAVGGYRERYKWLEDLDLFLRIAEIGKLANLPEVLLHYRMHVSSICHTHTDEQSRIRVDLYTETRRRRGQPPIEFKIPKNELKTTGDLHRLWAWWALKAGNVSTARKHALRSLRQSPLRVDNWRIVACALRGY